MTEQSPTRDESDRFLSIYETIGSSDSVSTSDLKDEIKVDNVDNVFNNTSNLRVSNSPKIDSLTLLVDDDSRTSDQNDTTNSATLSKEANSIPAKFDPNCTSDDYSQSNLPKEKVRRSLLRWVISGSIVGIALGFIQGNFEIVNREPLSAVAATPQMLSNSLSTDTVTKDSVLADRETVPVEVSLLINDAMINARRYFDQTSTYTGWRPATPILGASGGPYLVLAVIVKDTCYFTGIAPGFDQTTDRDPTGTRCDTNSINALQKKLDSIG
jgi:hypothetical protein